jgi:hypothetical protein
MTNDEFPMTKEFPMTNDKWVAQAVAQATRLYRLATRQPERVRRSVFKRAPFFTLCPAPLGSPAGRASGPSHPFGMGAWAFFRAQFQP